MCIKFAQFPLHSPVLLPLDNHLLPKLKKEVGGRHCDSRDDLTDNMNRIMGTEPRPSGPVGTVSTRCNQSEPVATRQNLSEPVGNGRNLEHD